LIIGIGYNHNSAKDENGNQLPFISPNTVNWKLTYTQKEYGFIASMRGRWYDKKPVMDEQTNQSIYINAGDASYFFVSDYSVIDIKVSKKFFDMAEISTGINNITDKIIYPFGQIKGREFFVGASFNIK
jgi:outer membrane receptor for ferrienterochelin and colicin